MLPITAFRVLCCLALATAASLLEERTNQDEYVHVNKAPLSLIPFFQPLICIYARCQCAALPVFAARRVTHRRPAPATAQNLSEIALHFRAALFVLAVHNINFDRSRAQFDGWWSLHRELVASAEAFAARLPQNRSH